LIYYYLINFYFYFLQLHVTIARSDLFCFRPVLVDPS